MTRRLRRLVLLRIRNQFLDWSGAWWFTVTLVASEAVGPLLGLVVWSAVLPGDPAVAGYFVALVAVQLLTASYENHTFSEAIYEGKISHDLLRPQPVIVAPIGENVAIRIWLGIFGLPLTLVTALAVGVSYDWTALAAAVPLLVGAAVLRFLWTWLLALAAFWTGRVHALVTLGGMMIFLLGGGAAPVWQLPDAWQPVVGALPFYAMLGLPADVATGSVHGSALAVAYLVQLAWSAVFAGVAVVAWRAGVRRFTAVGA
ncbi:ABC-2 family transporter protein [Polymorphospora sp. NPDC050346]|uniref:ABC-2 family transporter protein n=1 Tax=Polymorphospora sp. NPDC050346 TaxID=3155780 RepID=UPI0033F2D865